MSEEELKNTLKYLKNKNNTRRIKTITITEAQKIVEEIERLKNQLEEKTYLYNKLSTESEYAIKQLHSIIKEVREYIKDACYLDEINYPNSLGHKQTMKILEILDKEGNSNE